MGTMIWHGFQIRRQTLKVIRKILSTWNMLSAWVSNNSFPHFDQASRRTYPEAPFTPVIFTTSNPITT